MKFLPQQFDRKKALRGFAALILLAGLFEPFFFPTTVSAAAKGYLRLDRVKVNTATGGSVCFNPNITETTNVLQMAITFPVSGTPGTADATHFGVNQTGSGWTWDTTATNIPTGTSAFPGTPGTTTISAGTVTFVVSANQTLTTGTTYCLHFTGTNTLTTPTSAGNNFAGTISLNTTAGAPIANESVGYAASIVSNDQIAVTATVTSTFSMALSSNTAALTPTGGLPTSGAPAAATGITLTVSTNAANGWTAWAKNANANSTLTSATTSDTSISSGAFTSGAGNIHNLTGAAGYGLAITTGTGSPTVATEYSTTSPSVGSLDSTQFEKILSNTTVANGNTATLNFLAEASPTTKPATDYTDTVTILASGQF